MRDISRYLVSLTLALSQACCVMNHPETTGTASEKSDMAHILVGLPEKFWEAPPSTERLREWFPKGIPDDYVVIDTGGAQNDLRILRLDNDTVIITVGEGENPDHASSINSYGRNMEILRRDGEVWKDVTREISPFELGPEMVATVFKDGSLEIRDQVSKKSQIFRYEGNRFTETRL